MLKWIKLEDETPEIGKKVIIKIKYLGCCDIMRKCSARAAIWTDEVTGEPQFCSECLYYSYPEIDKWFPLPEDEAEGL